MSEAVSVTGIKVKRKPLTAPAGVTITSSSIAPASVITTAAPHGLASDDTATIAGHIGSTPALVGDYVVTVLSPTTFSIPVAVTVAGAGGTATAGFVTMAEVLEVGPGGKSRNVKDRTTHNDGSESKVLGIVRQKDPTLKVNVVSANASYITLNDDFDNKIKAIWQIAFPSGRTRTGPGYVQAFEYDDAGVDDVEGATITLVWSGPVVEAFPE